MDPTAAVIANPAASYALQVTGNGYNFLGVPASAGAVTMTTPGRAVTTVTDGDALNPAPLAPAVLSGEGENGGSSNGHLPSSQYGMLGSNPPSGCAPTMGDLFDSIRMRMPQQSTAADASHVVPSAAVASEISLQTLPQTATTVENSAISYKVSSRCLDNTYYT